MFIRKRSAFGSAAFSQQISLTSQYAFTEWAFAVTSAHLPEVRFATFEFSRELIKKRHASFRIVSGVGFGNHN
jgi:hypothetical protein